MQFAHLDRQRSSRDQRRPSRSRVSAGEMLEDRCLLSGDSLYDLKAALYSTVETAPIAQPMSDVVEAQAMVGGSANPGGFTPTQIRHAYGFDQVFFEGGTIVGDGTGQTIAIVNAYHNPNAAADLAAFNAYFGLPAPPSFVQVDQNGGTDFPATNASWALETSLDVQWAHVFAPGASILLVEANTAGFDDLTAAVDYARNVPGVSVVSMSWGAAEWSGESFYNSIFTTPVGHAGVTFFGAAGNSGGPGVYPAYSPNVMAVGGTTLTLNGSNNIVSETAWGSVMTPGSGGGISQFQSQPSWQNGVVTQSATQRVMPDVAFNANPTTGVPVYDTFSNSPGTPWTKVAGTSFATPSWAALVAVANQGRTLASLPVFDTTALMTRIYSMASTNFNDITSGTGGGTIPQSAGVGFDAVTGRGSPKAALVVQSLVGASTAPLGVTLVAASDTGVSNSDRITKLNNSSGGTTLQFQVSGTVAGATVSLYSGATLIGTAVASGTTTTVTTNGSATLADGARSITARQTEPGKSQSNASPALSITVDTTAPVASIVPVSPDPRTTPVSSIALQFSEVVSGLNLAALALTRDAGANLLTGSQTVSTLDGVTWTLANLTGITSFSGLYQLLLTSALAPVIDLAGNTSGNANESFTVTASVLGRRLFYNQSSFDGNNGAINASDDAAIATDKTAYLPGSGLASFNSVSSYSRGINGIMVDISGSHPGITAADFVFRVGNNNAPSSWAAAPAPLAVSVRAGAGVGGSDRVEIIWANGSITNKWLEVMVLPTTATGLSEADVFFWGNKIADSGTSPGAGIFSTTSTDSAQVLATIGGSKPITDLRDYNRDGQITSTDSAIVLANIGSIVRLNLSAGGPFAPEAIAATAMPDVVASPTVAAESAEPVPAVPAIAGPLTVAAKPVQAIDRSLEFTFARHWSQIAQEAAHAWNDLGAEDGLLDLLAKARRAKR